jgi:hypothetical protein
MKAYWGYEESSNKTNWPEHYKDYKWSSGTNRVEIRYCAFCDKMDFIRTVGRGFTPNWIKIRTGETGNELDIQLSKDNLGFVIVREWQTNVVIAIIHIKKKEKDGRI